MLKGRDVKSRENSREHGTSLGAFPIKRKRWSSGGATETLMSRK